MNWRMWADTTSRITHLTRGKTDKEEEYENN